MYKADLKMMLREPLEKSIVRSNEADIIAWDNVQQKLMCCGVNGPNDWAEYSKNKTLRASCCQPNAIDMITKDCRRNTSPYPLKYYQVLLRSQSQAKRSIENDHTISITHVVCIPFPQDGCLMKLEERIGSNSVILIGVGIGVAFVQILGIVLACWLATAIRKGGDN